MRWKKKIRKKRKPVATITVNRAADMHSLDLRQVERWLRKTATWIARKKNAKQCSARMKFNLFLTRR